MRRFCEEGACRFLTFSCQKRLPLLARPSVKDVMLECLLRNCQEREVILDAWVIMANHVHLIVRVEESDRCIPSLLSSLKGKSAKLVLPMIAREQPELYEESKSNSGDARLWLPGGGYDRVLHSGTEIAEKIRYVEENPVRRGLCLRPEDYPWSSAAMYK